MARHIPNSFVPASCVEPGVSAYIWSSHLLCGKFPDLFKCLKGTLLGTHSMMCLWMLMVYSLVTTSLVAERPFFFSPFFVVGGIVLGLGWEKLPGHLKTQETWLPFPDILSLLVWGVTQPPGFSAAQVIQRAAGFVDPWCVLLPSTPLALPWHLPLPFPDCSSLLVCFQSTCSHTRPF